MYGAFTWIDDLGEQLAFVVTPAWSEATAKADAPQGSPWSTLWQRYFGGSDTREVKALRREVVLLREQVDLLQDTLGRVEDSLDFYQQNLLAELRAENQLLRDTLRRRYAAEDGAGAIIPRPGDDVLARLLQETGRMPGPPRAEGSGPPASPAMGAPSTAPDAAVPGAPPAAPAPPPPPAVPEVIAEWGRTPAQVAALGAGATSLKGSVLLVPRGVRREDLAALGRELRQQYDGYDNINIEVFDQREAAERVAAGEAAGANEHRVLSVSRHRASGRDVILLVDGEQTVEVPRGTEGAAARP